MSLKKAIQDLINHSKQHQEKEVTEKLSSYRECYPLSDFKIDNPFISFWNTYRILHTQATYPSKKTKKAYEALVGEVLSAEDAPTNQKNISKIAALAKLVVLSIKYTYELNYRAINIVYRIVAIIKKTCNYGNDQLAVNAYYQVLWELRKLSKANIISKTASVIESNKGTFTLDHTWYNIKNLWKGKKKTELEETEESEEWFHTLPPSSPTEDPFKKISLEPVFDKFNPKEGLYEFRKKGMTNKNLAFYLSKYLQTLLKIRKQVLKDKRTF